MQAGLDYTIRQIAPGDRVSGFSVGNSDFQALKTFRGFAIDQLHAAAGIARQPAPTPATYTATSNSKNTPVTPDTQ